MKFGLSERTNERKKRKKTVIKSINVRFINIYYEFFLIATDGESNLKVYIYIYTILFGLIWQIKR